MAPSSPLTAARTEGVEAVSEATAGLCHHPEDVFSAEGRKKTPLGELATRGVA